MPRFVILEHDHPARHWDLMLEYDGVLKTWRLEAPPARGRGLILAAPLADHRLAYLDYEGPVSGNRGTVTRWDAGEYAARWDPDGGWAGDLAGERVRGRAALRRTGDAWHFAWEGDAAV